MRSLLLFLYLALYAVTALATNEVETIIRNIPDISGTGYRADKMAGGVNRLRALGKESLLRGFTDYASNSLSFHESAKIHLLCRLLFVKKSGWTPPALGKPNPDLEEANIAHFPIFPLALSQRVPFLVIEGYSLGGRAEPTAWSISECRNLPLIDHDLSITNHAAAAVALVESSSFRELYKDMGAFARMRWLIRRQAGLIR